MSNGSNADFIHIQGEPTSISGTVNSRDNEQTWSLENGNLVLMIKHDLNHNNVHHFKLNVTQSTFPFHFQLTNLHDVNMSPIILKMYIVTEANLQVNSVMLIN